MKSHGVHWLMVPSFISTPVTSYMQDFAAAHCSASWTSGTGLISSTCINRSMVTFFPELLKFSSILRIIQLLNHQFC